MAAVEKEEESDEIQILQFSVAQKKRIRTRSRKHATELDSQVKTCLWKVVNAVADSVDQDPNDLLVLVHRIPLDWDEDMVDEICSSNGPSPIDNLQLVPLAYYPFKSALVHFVDPEDARLTVCRSPVKRVDAGGCIIFEFAITPVKYDVLYEVTIGKTTIGKMEFIDYLETFGKIYRCGSYSHMARTDGVVSYCDCESYMEALRAEHKGIADSRITVRPLPASADWLDRVESNDVVMYGWTNQRSKKIRHVLHKYDLKVEITVIPSSVEMDVGVDEDSASSAIISFSRQEFADKFLADHKALRLEDGSTLVVKRVLTDAQIEPALKAETFTRRYMRWRDSSMIEQVDYYTNQIKASIMKNRGVDTTKDDAEDDITIVAVKPPKNLNDVPSGNSQTVVGGRETRNHGGILLSSSNAPTWTWDDSPGDTEHNGVVTGRKKELSGAQKKKLKRQKWLESLGMMTTPTVVQPDIHKGVDAARIVTEPNDIVPVVVGGNASSEKAKSSSGNSLTPRAKLTNVLGKPGIPNSILNNPYSMRAQILKANPELIAVGVPEKFPQSFKARGSMRSEQPKYPPKKKPKLIPDPNRITLGDNAKTRHLGNTAKVTRTGRPAPLDGIRNDGIVYPPVEDVMMDICEDDDVNSDVFNPANPVGRKGAGIHMDAYTGTNPFGRKFPSKRFEPKRVGHMDSLYIGNPSTQPVMGMMNAYAMPGSSGATYGNGASDSGVNQIPLSNPRQFGHGGASGDSTRFSLNPGVVDPFPAWVSGHQGFGSFSQIPQWTPSGGNSVYPASNVAEGVNATPIGHQRQFGVSGSMVPSIPNLWFPTSIANDGWYGRNDALASISQNPTPVNSTNRSNTEKIPTGSVHSGRTWAGFVDDRKSFSTSTTIDQAGVSSGNKSDPISRSNRGEANAFEGVNAIPISNPRKFSGGGNPEVVPGTEMNAKADYGSFDGSWRSDFYGGSSVPSYNLSSQEGNSGISGAKFKGAISSYSAGLSAQSSKTFSGGTVSSKATLSYPTAAGNSGGSTGAKLGDYLNAYLKGSKGPTSSPDSVNNIPVNPKRSFVSDAGSVGSAFPDSNSSGVNYRSMNFSQPTGKKNNIRDWQSDAMGVVAGEGSGGYGMFDPILLNKATASVGTVSKHQPPKTTKRPPPPTRGSGASNNNVRLLLEAADVSHATIEVLARENLLHPIVLCAIREEDLREMNVSIGDRKRINVVIKALSAGCP